MFKRVCKMQLINLTKAIILIFLGGLVLKQSVVALVFSSTGKLVLMSTKLDNGNFFNVAIMMGFYKMARTIFVIIHSFKYIFHNSSFNLSKIIAR